MQVILILISVVVPVFLVAAVGYVWARKGEPFSQPFIARLVTLVGTPLLVLDSLTSTPLDFATFGKTALAAVVVIAITLATGALLLKAMGESRAVYLGSLVFSNAGNMGLPLCLFAFGQPGVAYAMAFFTVSSLANFTIGQAIAAGGMSIGQILRVPMLWAAVLALVMPVLGLSFPPILARAIHMLAGMTIPLMLISLGYSLAQLKIVSLRTGMILSAARLFGGFAIGWGVAWLFGLEGVTRGVVVIQSAMPVAVYNYMFAARYNNGPEDVAGLVVLSTLVSLPVLPLFLWTVM